MARPDQEAIETFMIITGAPEEVAVQRLQVHGGDLNAAVNAHYNEGDRTLPANVPETAVVTQNDFMDIDDLNPEPRGPPLSLLSAAREMMNPFSMLDPNLNRGLFDSSSGLTSPAPFVTHPREVREIPIEVRDGNQPSGPSGHAPKIEDVSGTADPHGQDIHGTVIIDDEEDEDTFVGPTSRVASWGGVTGNTVTDGSRNTHVNPSAPKFDQYEDNGNDIEEEMIRAAIKASKREARDPNQQFIEQDDLIAPEPQGRQSHLEDAEIAQEVSLSPKTAEQEKASNPEEAKASGSTEVKMGTSESKGRLEAGSSSTIQDEPEDLEEQHLVRNRSRRTRSGYSGPAKEAGAVDVNPPSSPGEHNTSNIAEQNENAFPAEWGGISSEEHDEAVMLEAAMFGGIPEGTGYHFPYAPHQFMRNEDSYLRSAPRPPSPSLTAQRLIREQQDDEYLASLQADREKELKALEEAEARREEERQKEEENHRKLEEEQELERQLATKEASLPAEPASDDENSVTLLVRMPDGTRRGRRFLKSEKLQLLFDFIDIGKVVKPGSYRLVRPYPRRAFSDGESGLTLNELGLTSKQEALFLELI